MYIVKGINYILKTVINTDWLINNVDRNKDLESFQGNDNVI